ncbi:sigma factor-like helix-turn-helix DNA-binding protein [Sphingomonas pituitosa]|uniref:sigma factor-like helix-turn-helix DNA-binding protein n=1 Tax=Sphingomonas pituitosa TaxID=99597 RepID=UPI00082A684B|nr:sigma factor-like helix-turn-helix DNA-binding protein [Sphingomonas pituitosa]
MQRAADHHHINHRYWAADEAADAAIALVQQTPPLPVPDIAATLQVLAGNRVAKHRRRAMTLAEVYLPTADAIQLPSSHDSLCARQDLDRIRAAVSEADWRLIEMVALGHSHSEIAKELDLAGGTVKNRLSQLRRRLLH